LDAPNYFASNVSGFARRMYEVLNGAAFERALIAYARKFPLRKGKLRVIDRLWRVASGSRGTARLANLGAT
jgi:hypothetical protein